MSGENVEPPSTEQGIEVTFAIACYNAGEFLPAAVASALAQDRVALEVIVVDDGSSDGSYELAQGLAEEDPRIRVFRTAANAGPAGARNVALSHMRGEWVAILDSDDLIEPERTRALIDMAQDAQADLVADNLLEFGDGLPARPMFDFGPDEGWRRLEITEYFARSRLFGSGSSPGFLKPMIRRSTLERLGLRYNEDMRIGEDDELVVRALAAGCRYAVTGRTMYHYRKHTGSISHRLSLENATRMLAAERRIRQLLDEEVRSSPAYRGRWSALVRGQAFVQSIERLKSGDALGAATALIRHPSAALLYRLPLCARLRGWISAKS